MCLSRQRALSPVCALPAPRYVLLMKPSLTGMRQPPQGFDAVIISQKPLDVRYSILWSGSHLSTCLLGLRLLPQSMLVVISLF